MTGAERLDAELSLDRSPRPEERDPAALPADGAISAGAADVDPDGFDLDEVEAFALAGSPNLREAAADARAAHNRAYQAGLYPNPTVYTASPQWTGSISQYNVFVGQDIVTGGKLQLSRAALARQARQASLKYERARFDLLTAVRKSFYGALIAQRRVEVLESLVAIADKSHATAQKLLEAQVGTTTDKLLLEIELDKAQVALTGAMTVLDASRDELAAVLGDPTLRVARVVGNLSHELPDFEYEAVRQGVVSRNALLEIARVDVARNRLLLERSIVEPIPNLNLQGGYQYQVEAPLHNQGLAQLSLVIPLWNRNQGAIRAAQADTSAAVARVGRVENELSALAAATLGAYLAATQVVERYEQKILPNAEEVLRITTEAWEKGEFDTMRVLQAQKTLVEAQLNVVNAQESRWQTAISLSGLLQDEQFP